MVASPELEPWRWPVSIVGQETELHSGTKVFLVPEAHVAAQELVAEMLPHVRLLPRHVFVDAEAEPHPQLVLSRIPGREKVKIDMRWALEVTLQLEGPLPRSQMPFVHPFAP